MGREIAESIYKPIDDWSPRTQTMEMLAMFHRIPKMFIVEQLMEFKTYWMDRGERRPSWDALFIKRCASQWKQHGHYWKEAPDAQADRESQRRALHEATTGATRNDW